jgi:hypothetical protein
LGVLELREILNWLLLEGKGCNNISELKKQIKCRECNCSLDIEKEFFGYRLNGGQTVVRERTAKDYQEVLLRDYTFSHSPHRYE